MTNEATTPSGQPLGISHKPSNSGAMFTKFKAENKPAFIGYLPYGFPNPDVSLDAFKTMVEYGVDAVEIGLPYSDPVMDGPVIQAAASIALNNGETIKRVFEAVETVANAGGVPLIMSYWNLVYHYGVERFARDFENAGGAGLITPDLIPDRGGGGGSKPPTVTDSTASSWSPRTSSTERLETVARNARGFVYAAARMGVTGERATIDASPEPARGAHPSGRCRERVRGHRRVHRRTGRQGRLLRGRRHRRLRARAHPARGRQQDPHATRRKA